VWVATAGFRRGNAGIDRNVDGDRVALSSALFGVASAVMSQYVSTAFVVLKSWVQPVCSQFSERIRAATVRGIRALCVDAVAARVCLDSSNVWGTFCC